MERELKNPPSSGITAIEFDSSDRLLASSWDCSLSLYSVSNYSLLHRYPFSTPLLNGCWAGNDRIITAELSGDVSSIDINTNQSNIIAHHHNSSARIVRYLSSASIIVSGGWDGGVHFIDERSGIIGTTNLSPLKVYAMAVHSDSNQIIVATNDLKVYLIDARHSLSSPSQSRTSSLLHQTRAVEFFPAGVGYVLSSIEGRISVEYIDKSEEIQAQKYAFKSHRKFDAHTGEMILSSVNSLAFHPFGTFASGGCDGFVNVWDVEYRKRICQYHEYPSCVNAISFNRTGDLLAIASSYNDCPEEKSSRKDSIFIRSISEIEVKPKLKR